MSTKNTRTMPAGSIFTSEEFDEVRSAARRDCRPVSEWMRIVTLRVARRQAESQEDFSTAETDPALDSLTENIIMENIPQDTTEDLLNEGPKKRAVIPRKTLWTILGLIVLFGAVFFSGSNKHKSEAQHQTAAAEALNAQAAEQLAVATEPQSVHETAYLSHQIAYPSHLLQEDNNGGASIWKDRTSGARIFCISAETRIFSVSAPITCMFLPRAITHSSRGKQHSLDVR